MNMYFKAYKIKKAEYSNLPALLRRIGLVKGNEASPNWYVVSSKTFKVFGKELRKLARKQYPHVSNLKIKGIVNMELLQLGPIRLDKGVEFGYAITVTESENMFLL